MSLEAIHEAWVAPRRIRILAEILAPMLVPSATVLDLGCGDGRLARTIHGRRPDTTFMGVDVLVRADCAIPVRAYDGQALPFHGGAFDSVLIVDVLHHTDDPLSVLREAKRVTRRQVLVKDHLADGLGARATLRVMDWVGNSRFGVALPYNYMDRKQWHRFFDAIGMVPKVWSESLGLYPWPYSLLFDRHLHFVADVRTQDVG